MLKLGLNNIIHIFRIQQYAWLIFLYNTMLAYLPPLMILTRMLSIAIYWRQQQSGLILNSSISSSLIYQITFEYYFLPWLVEIRSGACLSLVWWLYIYKVPILYLCLFALDNIVLTLKWPRYFYSRWCPRGVPWNPP